ncbi:MAG TPA: MFS transporter [Anaerolineaceae bacterium]|jgi:GPH family glycoside/pentoside/hexuronide:cation symporter|nr:MAG: sugar (glycoside-Pentoside-hexuronide) transporter [Marinimicrobia bacterium 46_43]HAF47766.1 MFS transporter [Anaerolineaceae bacterium]
MEEKEKLPLWRKIVYGSGDLGFSMNNSIITAFFSVFMVTVVGMPPGLVAIIFIVGRSWDFINDPIIGHLSDRTRTRWGRRRPFLLFGAIPFGLSFSLLWLSPDFSRTGLIIYYSLAYIVYEALATTVYMPYFALTPELTDDYDERTNLTSFRMMFNIIGSLTAYILPLLIIGNDWTQATKQDVLTMALIAGAIAATPILLVFFGTKEKKEYQKQSLPKFFPSLKAAFKNRPFVFGALMYLFTWMTIVVVESNLQFFIIHIVQRQSQSMLIMVSIFVTAIFALPIWNWVSKNWNKRYAYIAGVAFWAVVMMVLIFMTPETPFWLILLLCVMAGIGVSAAQVLPWAIIPDAIEWEEWQTGERNEGMFYSLITLMGKVGMAIAQPLSLLILQFMGFKEGQGVVQSANGLLGIRLVMGPLPAILLLSGIVMAIFYPLTRQQHHEIVEALRLRRQERKLKRAEKKPLPGVEETI